MTLQQKIGQFFFPAVFINDTEENIQETERLIKEYNIGGLTFFHSRASAATNYEKPIKKVSSNLKKGFPDDPRQKINLPEESKKKVEINEDSYQRLKDLIVRYQKCSTTPLLMSIDAEWGLAMRVEKTPQYPYAITLGALPDSEIGLVYEVGKQIALDLKSAGIHYNLAPLADINNNPNNPVIGYRSFGSNKEKVARFALEYLRGMSDVGILGCLKHFPGHGNTNVDSHLGLPVLTENLEQLLENELVPFIKGIENQVDSIMIGHLAVPALNDGKDTSATLSKNIIESLLRERLGYDGLVISDALNMHSVSKLYDIKGQLEWEAFNAGNDVLCFAENVPEGIQEILKNATPERIEASYNRVIKCKQKAGLFDSNPTIAGDFDFKITSELNRKIADYCITDIKDNNSSIIVFDAKNRERLAKLSVYKTIENPFFKTLAPILPSPEYAIENANDLIDTTLKEDLAPFDTVLISLFVPKAKPLNKFDLEDSVLDFLGQLFQTKKCILYVFGNPYALQVIPNLEKAIGIVEMYQDFVEFQESAAKQLLEDKKGKGSLPVSIPTI
ncbi:glycoside hydrolase family 3 protein [Flavobacterium sp. ZT3R18]|uniref:glycoside hydrolase family 3 protein n=1 Tax=Flavobacterium sp. ZT3R18 TaxID=2594429 RepID=UPI00117AA643|nr:glycoside hydrolase family 3 N-terminal domain-containing protein [Flavobacterium sp. ZT3R18]TRX33220.1 glycoside hydrolase family 3 protein [Flavobacterium sp. ZT3R18]